MPDKTPKRDKDHVPTAAEISQRLDRVAAQQEKTAAQSDRTEAQVAKTSATLDRFIEKDEKRAEKADKRAEEADKRAEKIDERFEETEKLVDRLAKQIGGVDKIFGDMAEYVSFTNLKRLLREQAGIEIKAVGKRWKIDHEGREYEFDLIAVGTNAVVVVEVKTTLRSDDIDDFAAIMPDVPAIFPEYRHMDIYGGFAYMKAQDGTEKRAHRHGLLTIRAIGASTSELVGFDKAQLRNFRQ